MSERLAAPNDTGQVPPSLYRHEAIAGFEVLDGHNGIMVDVGRDELADRLNAYRLYVHVGPNLIVVNTFAGLAELAAVVGVAL